MKRKPAAEINDGMRSDNDKCSLVFFQREIYCLLYRQSEWHSSTAPVTSINSLDAYHQSEQTLIPAQAGLKVYQLSERTLVDPFAQYLESERTLAPIVNADLAAYHLSERTMTSAINDLSQYVASERTLVDIGTGLATYFESERTSSPIQFTQYQFSEWFGE